MYSYILLVFYQTSIEIRAMGNFCIWTVRFKFKCRAAYLWLVFHGNKPHSLANIIGYWDNQISKYPIRIPLKRDDKPRLCEWQFYAIHILGLQPSLSGPFFSLGRHFR